MACTCQPGKALCESCLKSVYERNAVPTGPLSNPNGEYTFAQVEVFEKQFTNNIVEDVQSTALAEYSRKYSDFYDTVESINRDFLQRPTIKQQLPNYPVLNKRLEKGVLTPLEFAAFIKDQNYTPATAIISSNAQGSRFLGELEDYYNGDFATSVMGGFCSLFGSIFAAVDAFFDMIGQIDGLVQDVLAFIKKIKNVKDELLAAFEAIKVKALIEAIKEKISDMVEGAIKKVCQSIANFNVEAITGPLPTPTPAQVKVAEQAEEKKTELQQICGDENAKRIKEKIQALIDYAVGLFANPSVEEIVALIARICAMATGIEGLFQKLKDPLSDFSNRYDEVFNSLSNASNRVTGEAIRAGAIRPLETTRQNLINTAKELWEDAGNIRQPSLEELKNLPSWEQIKEHHDKLRIQGGWTNPDTGMKPMHEGWTRVNPVVKVLVMRLQKAAKEEGIISSYLILNSGFRNQQYNTKVGGVKQSQHLSGNAVDLTWPGFNPRSEALLQFVSLARREGFRGIGYYNNFIHLDIGPERSWDRR